MPTAINEQIKILAELQKVDSEIYRLRKELAGIPALQKKVEDDFEKKKAGMKAAEADLKAAQLKQKEKEGELASKEEKIKKLQGQLYSLKTNKEYTAMDLEIKGLKADNSLIEEEILRSFDGVEAAKAKCAAEKEALVIEEKKSKEETAVHTKRAAELTAAAAELDEKRKAYLPNIDPKLLSQYERVLKGREGLALVPVRNNSCGGCHIGLPPQTVNEVMMQEKLIFCEECARILYWMP
ncbi:MAG TPA: C4-type zinc ribbon domain-containing protein [Candidatus Eisenbacteria bacterium]|jgi:predicted  nucleic acid-binding Zn-ribbon protein|nr:C4-type zinc ribbon domain-containing protein [Candidatus Eisenbacteria bacterium]